MTGFSDEIALVTDCDRLEASQRVDQAVAEAIDHRLAGLVDRRPFGYITLMQAVYNCTCGAPFDLEAAPVFARMIAESGLPGFVVDNWYSILGPRGIPKPIVNRLHQEYNRALAQPDVAKRLEGFGIFPFPLPTSEAFGDYIKSEMVKYARVVKEAGIRVD